MGCLGGKIFLKLAEGIEDPYDKCLLTWFDPYFQGSLSEEKTWYMVTVGLLEFLISEETQCYIGH